jgi:hypothetical protein
MPIAPRRVILDNPIYEVAISTYENYLTQCTISWKDVVHSLSCNILFRRSIVDYVLEGQFALWINSL